MKERIGLYPGTFDPPTRGHLDIIERAAKLCDFLVIGVAENRRKEPLFSLEERVSFLKQEIQDNLPLLKDQLIILPFSGLMVEFAVEQRAQIIFRGLRALADFEYEFQMAWMNTRLNGDIETIFLMASERYQFVSSRLIKEIACLGGNIHPFLSSRIAKALLERCQ